MGPEVLEMVAVSVDTSLKAWTTAIQQNGYKWLNYCDGKGWYSLPALNCAFCILSLGTHARYPKEMPIKKTKRSIYNKMEKLGRVQDQVIPCIRYPLA